MVTNENGKTSSSVWKIGLFPVTQKMQSIDSTRTGPRPLAPSMSDDKNVLKQLGDVAVKSSNNSKVAGKDVDSHMATESVKDRPPNPGSPTKTHFHYYSHSDDDDSHTQPVSTAQTMTTAATKTDSTSSTVEAVYKKTNNHKVDHRHPSNPGRQGYNPYAPYSRSHYRRRQRHQVLIPTPTAGQRNTVAASKTVVSPAEAAAAADPKTNPTLNVNFTNPWTMRTLSPRSRAFCLPSPRRPAPAASPGINTTSHPDPNATNSRSKNHVISNDATPKISNFSSTVNSTILPLHHPTPPTNVCKNPNNDPVQIDENGNDDGRSSPSAKPLVRSLFDDTWAKEEQVRNQTLEEIVLQDNVGAVDVQINNNNNDGSNPPSSGISAKRQRSLLALNRLQNYRYVMSSIMDITSPKMVESPSGSSAVVANNVSSMVLWRLALLMLVLSLAALGIASYPIVQRWQERRHASFDPSAGGWINYNGTMNPRPTISSVPSLAPTSIIPLVDSGTATNYTDDDMAFTEDNISSSIIGSTPSTCEKFTYTQIPIQDQSKMECGLFAKAHELSIHDSGLAHHNRRLSPALSELLRLSDVGAQCPCSHETVRVGLERVTICDSSSSHGMDAYRAYCLETFAAFQSDMDDSDTYPNLLFELALTDLQRSLKKIGNPFVDGEKGFPVDEIQQEAKEVFVHFQRQVAIVEAEDNNPLTPCLEGCALFVRDACCQANV